MDSRLALITGIDIPVPECQLIVHQPSIKEISFIGEKDFFTGIQCLCLYKSMFVEDKNVLSDINNFQIFMMIMQEKEAKSKKQAVQLVLQLVFPTMQPIFTPNSLLFKPEEGDMIIVDSRNFEILQETLRQVFCMSEGPMNQRAFNPGGEKAKAIAEKIMKGRERIAAEKNSGSSSTFSQYLSILAIGLNKSIPELTELTMFQLYDLIERYQLWISWDLDVRIRIGGGKPDEKPDNWMKNLH